MAVGMNSLLGRYEQELAASNTPSEHKTSLDQDAFLTLLVAQLNNQDPLNPMDDKEMTGQLAEFSSLEQLTNINTNIQALGETQEQERMLSAVNYIGKSVMAKGYNVRKDGDTVSTVHYGLGETLSELRINVYDEDGDIVQSVLLGGKQPGVYTYQWDGKNYDGKEVPDGTYSVAMVAEDTNGEPVFVQTEVSGKVTGVVSEGGEQYLKLADGRYINFLNIKEVSQEGSVDDATDTEGDGAEETET
mgnify:CR=1 FL=1